MRKRFGLAMVGFAIAFSVAFHVASHARDNQRLLVPSSSAKPHILTNPEYLNAKTSSLPSSHHPTRSTDHLDAQTLSEDIPQTNDGERFRR